MSVVSRRLARSIERVMQQERERVGRHAALNSSKDASTILLHGLPRQAIYRMREM